MLLEQALPHVSLKNAWPPSLSEVKLICSGGTLGRSVEIPHGGHDFGIDDGVVLARVQINFAAAQALQRVYFPLDGEICGEAGEPLPVQDIGDP